MLVCNSACETRKKADGMIVFNTDPCLLLANTCFQNRICRSVKRFSQVVNGVVIFMFLCGRITCTRIRELITSCKCGQQALRGQKASPLISDRTTGYTVKSWCYIKYIITSNDDCRCFEKKFLNLL